MTKRQFLKRRRPAWKRFESLLSRLDASFSAVSGTRLAGPAVEEYSRLLREVSHDLAVVRAQGWDVRLEAYLNDLAGRGHNAFYRAPPGTLGQMLRYLTTTFPRLMRRNVLYMLVGNALFFVPFFLAWGLVYADSELAARVLPGDSLEQMNEMYSEESQAARSSGLEFGDQRSGMFGFYIWNNVGIALRTFALGLTLGVGTVVTLLSNGIAIGTVFGWVHSQGNGERLFSFAVGHGSFELVAIGVSGGAGLMLADALLHPGNRTRGESLLVRGREAIQVAVGAGAMLVVAALLEAFWSPAPIPDVVKYVVGSVLWLLVFAYIALAGRGGVIDEQSPPA